MSTAPPLPPVANLPNNLGPRLVLLLAQTLEPLGFTTKSNYRLFYYWTRRTQTLRQRCGLEFYYGAVYVWYDCRLASSPIFDVLGSFDSWPPAKAAAARRVVAHFQETSRAFSPYRDDSQRRNALNRSYGLNVDGDDAAERLARLLAEHIVPLFERRREALDLLRAYDDGTLAASEAGRERNLLYSFEQTPFNTDNADAELYFGPDSVLNVLNLSALRLQNGQNAEALALFDALADAKSSDCYTPYSRAAFELALLGAAVAKERLAVDGPGSNATRRPLEPAPSQTLSPRSFKRPSFASLNVDEAEAARLLWLARFSDDEAKATQAIQRLEELANDAHIVVYESPDARRLAANPTFDAASLSHVVAFSLRPTPPLLSPSSTQAPDPQTDDDALATLKSDLRRRLEEVFAQRLEPLGFKRGASPTWTQKTKSLRRYCRFAFWDRRDFFAVTFGYYLHPCYACWDDAPQDAESQAFIARFRKEKPSFEVLSKIGRTVLEPTTDFFGTPLYWKCLPKDGEFEPLVVQSDTFLQTEILPFFERFRETDDLLREYDAGRLEQAFALGREAGPGREFAAAQNYYRAGNYVEALARFEAVPERFNEFSFARDSVSENDRLLLEVARLGALSVRQKLESQSRSQADGAVSTVFPGSRRPVTPIPEPLATAHPHYDRQLKVFWTREFASSAFAPEAESATRKLKAGAESLRTCQEKCAQVLEPLGFTRENPVTWTLETATLCQRFHLEVLPGYNFGFYGYYYQKPDFSLWDAASQDVETQATLARFQALVEKRFANAYFAETHWHFDYERDSSPNPSSQTPNSSPLETILTSANKAFTKTVLPFFERWSESSDVLADPAPCDALSRFGFGNNDAGQAKFGYALALFQVGRYTESAKRFDALSKMKRKPYVWPEYDDADWSALQEAARLAAETAREIARFARARKKQ